MPFLVISQVLQTSGGNQLVRLMVDHYLFMAGRSKIRRESLAHRITLTVLLYSLFDIMFSMNLVGL